MEIFTERAWKTIGVLNGSHIQTFAMQKQTHKIKEEYKHIRYMLEQTAIAEIWLKAFMFEDLS